MSDAITNFIEAVYALYDAAYILIGKYGLDETKVMAIYRATVWMWHHDQEE